jgi:hypothetical protein
MMAGSYHVFQQSVSVAGQGAVRSGLESTKSRSTSRLSCGAVHIVPAYWQITNVGGLDPAGVDVDVRGYPKVNELLESTASNAAI